jgi:glyceraldehyde 3-phosphate dehydrogenase
MKKINIGINGLGRIGRLVLKKVLDNKIFNLKICNDINSDPQNIAYLLNFDSIYGQPKHKYSAKNNCLYYKKVKIYLLNKKKISLINWRSYGIDYLVDCSGVNININSSKKVLNKNKLKNIFISHSPKNVDLHMILGVNENEYDKKKHKVISSSICDSTAIAPVLKIINEKFGINNGSITTIHPALNYQNLLDNKCISWSDPKNFFNTFALGRSSIGNIIPKDTSAIQAVCQAYKKINEKNFISFSYRTENLIVASADLTLNLQKKTNLQEILFTLRNFEKKQKFKIIKNINEPLVSLDFKKSEYSANIDNRWTKLNQNTLKLVLWYDNEFGYSSNLVRQILHVDKNNNDK